MACRRSKPIFLGGKGLDRLAELALFVAEFEVHAVGS